MLVQSCAHMLRELLLNAPSARSFGSHEATEQFIWACLQGLGPIWRHWREAAHENARTPRALQVSPSESRLPC